MALTINDSLLTLLRERMALFDPEVDTSVGSRFDRVVVSPLSARLGPDPTATDASQVIIDRVNAYNANYSTDHGSGIRDTLINPLSMILEPYRRIAHTLVTRGSWENIERMTEEEADIKANNLFLSRNEGLYATGTLRLKFTAPRSLLVTGVNTAWSGSLKFRPTTSQSITSSKMATQTSGAYYYFDIQVTSDTPGDEYNLAAKSITSIDGVPGCVGVEQRYAFADGSHRQTNVELKAASELGITVRNLVNDRSIRTVLPDSDHFPAIARMEIIGRMDPAQERDLIRGGTNNISGIPQGVRGSANPDIMTGGVIHVGGFTDIWVHAKGTSNDVEESLDILSVRDEGLLVAWSTTGQVTTAAPRRLYDSRYWFTELDGAYMPVSVGDVLTIQGVLDSSHQHYEFDIVSVTDTYLEVSTGDPAISGVDLTDVSWEVRRREAGKLYLSPDTFVAEDDDGPLLTSSGEPMLPGPGRELESEGYASTRNVCAANMSLPLFYVSGIELLDNTASPPEPTGEIIPEADPIVHYVHRRVSETRVWVRTIYRHPTRFAPLEGTKFYTLDAGEWFTPAQVDPTTYSVASQASVNDLQITWAVGAAKTYTSDYPSRVVRVGDYLQVTDTSGTKYVAPIVDLNSGGIPGRVQVADSIFPTGVGDIAGAVFLQGITFADMTSGVTSPPLSGTDAMGFRYFDWIAERAGSQMQSVGATLATPPPGGIYSQGWRLLPRLEGYSFSTLEEPLLVITDTVNDTTDITASSSTSSNHYRLTYMTTPFVREVQEFLDSGAEHIPGEDMLVRRMAPARVHTLLSYTPDSVTSAPINTAAAIALSTAIGDASVGLSATELSNVLEDEGAARVDYPFSTIVEYSGKSRSGKFGYGQLMSFHGYDGCMLPPATDSIESLFRMGQFVPGAIVADSGE